MTRQVLINGTPGSGKSTLAGARARSRQTVALALAREQLSAGYDAVISQYVARSDFIGDLERVASALDTRFFEFMLDLNASALAERLAGQSVSLA
jgi:broad-specificity NMP kinase